MSVNKLFIGSFSSVFCSLTGPSINSGSREKSINLLVEELI